MTLARRTPPYPVADCDGCGVTKEFHRLKFTGPNTLTCRECRRAARGGRP